MPVYNCSAFVNEAIDSILHQTFSDFELIIIDDGSTDGTAEIIKGYTDKRIRFIPKEKNGGLIDSLNMGLSLATGKYIARMDGDDISELTRFEIQVHFLETNTDVMLCGTWIREMQTDNVRKFPSTFESIKLSMLDYCCFSHPTIMFRRDFLLQNNLLFNAEFNACEDYDMWVRMTKLGKLNNIPQVLLNYRLHANQITVKEGSAQFKHSTVCRAKMLCHPLPSPNIKDVEVSNFIVSETPIRTTTTLVKILNWLDALKQHNADTKFYLTESFNSYVQFKQRSLVRRVYLNETNYNLSVMLTFLCNHSYVKNKFSFFERLKFYVKCMVLWQS